MLVENIEFNVKITYIQVTSILWPKKREKGYKGYNDNLARSHAVNHLVSV